MVDALWVVPCYFDPDRPIVFECIRAIKRYHKDPKILVVDSGSPDRSYLDLCVDMGCKVAPINNKLYGFGAHAWAIRHYGEVEFFYLIFDSLIVQSNCDEFRERPVTAIRHFSSQVHDWGWDENGAHLSGWGHEQLARMGVPVPAQYSGLMGPMAFMQRDVIDKLDHMGYFFTQTSSKYLLCGMERVSGIVLESMGIDVTQSLQGPHGRHEDVYDETYVRKINMARS